MASVHLRNLAGIEAMQSNARILNLRKTYEKYAAQEDYQEYPFFKNKRMNRSIVVKHKLQGSEITDFPELKPISTKIIIPIDIENLKNGAFIVFVGQNNFNRILSERLYQSEIDLNYDLNILNILDSITTLDPFILKNQLERNGIKVADAFFKIKKETLSSIQAFVEAEMLPLTHMAFGGVPDNDKAKILATKILSTTAIPDTDEFRKTLNIKDDQYREGFFCWKSILYYKWKLKELIPNILILVSDIAKVTPQRMNDNEKEKQIARIKISTIKNSYAVIKDINIYLDNYNTAFLDLVQGKNPKLFIDFLLNAPNILNALAARIGALNHMLDIWWARFPQGSRPLIKYEELIDMLSDFETNLSFD